MTRPAVLLLAVLLPSLAYAVPLPQPRPAALKAGPAGKTSEPEAQEAQVAEAAPENADAVPLPEPRSKNLATIPSLAPPSADVAEAEVPLDPIPDPLCDELEASGGDEGA